MSPEVTEDRTAPARVMYGCITCLMKSPSPIAYQAHKRYCEQPCFTCCCSVCNYKAESPETITIHISLVHVDVSQLIACTECGSHFKTQTGLKKHMEVKHRTNPTLKCPICGKVMYNKINLDGHVNKHKGLKPHVSYGNLSYQQSSTLQLALPLLPSTDYPHYQHTLADRGQLHGQPLVTQTGSTEHGIPCRACPDVFTSMEELNYHMEFTHHYVACSHCTVWCPSPAALRGHILREHKPKLEEEEGETSSFGGKQGTSELLGKFAAYECSYCSIIVTDYPSLSLHSKTCPSPSCSMICLTCGDKFPSKPEMRVHLKFMHSHKTFGCKFCDMMFSSSSGLLSHTKAKHKPDPKTLCQICGQAFHNRANLEGHMNMHMGLKPFKCKKCDKCYGHSKSLMTHEKNCSKSLSAVGKGRSQWSRLSSSRDNSFLHRGEHCMQQPSLANKRSCELDIPSSSQPFSFPDRYHSTFDGDKKLENNSSIQASQSSSDSYTYNDPSYQSLHSLNMESISTASVLNDSVFDQASSDFVLPQVPFDVMYPHGLLPEDR
ncbi:oocyte zinc finger protein XlCOF6 [Biomphalaria glabrata]|nr:oocyte zinc finger protein XlCOF6-like [Biomphalaria glabrata]KAI8789834.1 oocyte zinc finger protein XlCOF6 [Biomphalaria glabrata]